MASLGRMLLKRFILASLCFLREFFFWRFPSALQASRGGILADAIGLGKTVMTISLLLSNRRKGCSTSQVQPTQAKTKSFKSLKEGGTLIICPMTLLSQWRSELEAHVSPGTVSVFAYYGPDRSRDAKTLSKYDVVLTTYGVVQSECNNSGGEGPIHNVHWFRVVLDKAHSIKANKSCVAQAVFKLVADRRLCLTGTPVPILNANYLSLVIFMMPFTRHEELLFLFFSLFSEHVFTSVIR
ncbi:DNA repair protein RAD5A-like isoform X2 [Selaginella moellendorffii]|uniref:DNA repair protein RAD5A-like isoform X2 n=1 Tax=Selaginella moellendorffii TaxID=88036 RepID=UPI000D1CB977|nr:DNA repair protein RAD5A-like isoform X2 [Selaginella moellendorffii]|eukprot:XP_024522203.1 DNA repair protein RAD5A-like isoform X2 [Selaginella moellendorffii]